MIFLILIISLQFFCICFEQKSFAQQQLFICPVTSSSSNEVVTEGDCSSPTGCCFLSTAMRSISCVSNIEVVFQFMSGTYVLEPNKYFLPSSDECPISSLVFREHEGQTVFFEEVAQSFGGNEGMNVNDRIVVLNDIGDRKKEREFEQEEQEEKENGEFMKFLPEENNCNIFYVSNFHLMVEGITINKFKNCHLFANNATKTSVIDKIVTLKNVVLDAIELSIFCNSYPYKKFYNFLSLQIHNIVVKNSNSPIIFLMETKNMDLIMDVVVEDSFFFNISKSPALVVAIMGKAKAEMRGCVFKNNINNGGDESFGGALYFVSQLEISAKEEIGDYVFRMTVTNCNFTKNKAEKGGALYLQNTISFADYFFDNCHFINNTAKGTGGGLGGAIYLRNPYNGTNARFLNTHFTNNEAIQNGGGIYMQYSLNNVSLTLEKCSFSDNNANTIGGAVRLQVNSGDCFLNFIDNIFTNNVAYDQGGCIHVSCTSKKIKDSHWSGNKYINNNAYEGGVAYLTSSDLINLEISNEYYSVNQAKNGGSFYISGRDIDIHVMDSVFENNFDSILGLFGGVMYFLSTDYLTINVERSNFNGNYVMYKGGAFYGYLMNSVFINFYDSIFSNNSSPVVFEKSSAPEGTEQVGFYNVTFVGNYGDVCGIHVQSMKGFYCENSTFIDPNPKGEKECLSIYSEENLHTTFSYTNFFNVNNDRKHKIQMKGNGDVNMLWQYSKIENGLIEISGGDFSSYSSNFVGTEMKMEDVASVNVFKSELLKCSFDLNYTTDSEKSTYFTMTSSICEKSASTLLLDNLETINIINSDFRRNHDLTYNGGALTVKRFSDFLVKNSSFVENEGYTGGAISLWIPVSKKQVTVTIDENSKLLRNNAKIFGGGLYIKIPVEEMNEKGRENSWGLKFSGHIDENFAKNGGAVFIDSDGVDVSYFTEYFKNIGENNNATYNPKITSDPVGLTLKKSVIGCIHKPKKNSHKYICKGNGLKLVDFQDVQIFDSDDFGLNNSCRNSSEKRILTKNLEKGSFEFEYDLSPYEQDLLKKAGGSLKKNDCKVFFQRLEQNVSLFFYTDYWYCPTKREKKSSFMEDCEIDLVIIFSFLIISLITLILAAVTCIMYIIIKKNKELKNKGNKIEELNGMVTVKYETMPHYGSIQGDDQKDEENEERRKTFMEYERVSDSEESD